MARTDIDPEATPSEDPAAPDRQAQLALGVFVATVVCAFWFYVDVGRNSFWFRADDWTPLVSLDGADLSDLFHELHDHWSTVPIVVYRSIFHLFGLRYLPYLVVVVSLHVTVAVLLRVIMRRVGVGPWIATAAASMFLLLSAIGWNDIVWSYQLGFDASLVFGLGHLLLADHDGPFIRRDAAGLLCGLGALMSSGVGMTMVAIVGVAVLIRRGWRLALVHAAPLAAVYLTWYYSLTRRSYTDSGGPLRGSDVARFVLRGLTNTLTRDVRFRGGLLILLAVLAVGLPFAWIGPSRESLRQRAAMPVAMLLGAFVFLAIVAVGRGSSLSVEYATTTRFVHITTALLAPALAVAADAIAQRYAILVPLLCVLFVAGVPANLRDLGPAGMIGDRDLITAVANLPALESLPRSVRPFGEQYGEAQLTTGWLRDARRAGRIDRAHPTPNLEADALLRVAFRISNSPPRTACSRLRAGVRHFEKGDTLDFRGALLWQVVTPRGGRSRQVQLVVPRIVRVTTRLGPLDVRITPVGSATTVCN